LWSWDALILSSSLRSFFKAEIDIVKYGDHHRSETFEENEKKRVVDDKLCCRKEVSNIGICKLKKYCSMQINAITTFTMFLILFLFLIIKLKKEYSDIFFKYLFITYILFCCTFQVLEDLKLLLKNNKKKLQFTTKNQPKNFRQVSNTCNRMCHQFGIVSITLSLLAPFQLLNGHDCIL
ncbi:hypothetical protein RFI_33097, partial [Reticulomyxa filosa]